LDKYTNQTAEQQKPGTAEIMNFILERLAAITGLNPSKINVATEFISFGLDSAEAANLSGELSEWLNLNLEENLLWEHPTPEQLVEYLVDQT
jgi:8-amino-7-oxononanoate synthase